MKPNTMMINYMLIGAIALTMTATHAAADDTAEAIRKALATLDPSVHKVYYRQKTSQSSFRVILEDDAGGTRENVSEQVCMGLAVSADGLVLVGGHIFPDPYAKSVNAGIISLSEQKSQPKDFRVEIGEEKLPASLVVYDKELNVALLRVTPPTEAGAKPIALQPIQFDAKAKLGVADRFHVMTMLAEKYDYQKSFRTGRVRAIVGKKRQRYLQNAVSGYGGLRMDQEQLMGGPVFDDAGRVIGIMGLQPAKPPKEKRTTGLNPGRVRQQVFISSIRAQQPLIVRAEEILPLIENPLRNEKARGWVGFQEMQTLTFSMRRHVGLNKGLGMLLSLVGHGSPAADSGIQSGDLLLRVGDHAVQGKNEEDLQELRKLIRELPVGAAVEIEVRRDTSNGPQKVVAKVTPKERPRNVYEAETYEHDLLGIGVKEVTYDMIERKNLDFDDLGGCYVTKVPIGGLFSLAGARTGELIRVGDILQSVNGERVTTVDDVKRVFTKLEETRAKDAVVKIKRYADTRFLKVKLDWTP